MTTYERYWPDVEAVFYDGTPENVTDVVNFLDRFRKPVTVEYITPDHPVSVTFDGEVLPVMRFLTTDPNVPGLVVREQGSFLREYREKKDKKPAPAGFATGGVVSGGDYPGRTFSYNALRDAVKGTGGPLSVSMSGGGAGGTAKQGTPGNITIQLSPEALKAIVDGAS